MDHKSQNAFESPGGQQGAILVFVALCLVVLLGVAALAIDIGSLYATRSELQNIADAAALAGTRYLGAQYAPLDPSAMGSHTFTKEEVFAVVNGVANKNKAGNKAISIKMEDVEIGLWDVTHSDDDIWTPTLVGPDAVRVIARRDSTANNPVSTFLATVLNINSMDVVSNKAIAALTGPSFVEEGVLKTPFGLSEKNFPNDCKPVISFSPTASSCAAWHNFFDPMNASDLPAKLLGLIQGDTQSYAAQSLISGPQWLNDNFDLNKTPTPEETPTTAAGDEFNFKGGEAATLFTGDTLGLDYDGNHGTVSGNGKNPATMIALFDYFRYRDGDGHNEYWTTTVPVYKDDDPNSCINANTSLEILGFAEIVVYGTDPPPSKDLSVHVDCNLKVIDARGGGTTYGNLKGTLPNLVK